MIKIAVYGKGGIGKSTTVSNVAAVFASQGLRVMQIGCDPKADSTVLLRHGEKVETVLDLVRTRKENFTLEEMVKEGFAGVCCVEAGGPSPGLGCAGRGIIAALEILEKKVHMRNTARMLSFMMFLAMLSVVDFPCQCAVAMPIKYLLLLLVKIWQSMRQPILQWQ